jgi:pimeloyl-ACP methyl ester carboxylesterase
MARRCRRCTMPSPPKSRSQNLPSPDGPAGVPAASSLLSLPRQGSSHFLAGPSGILRQTRSRFEIGSKFEISTSRNPIIVGHSFGGFLGLWLASSAVGRLAHLSAASRTIKPVCEPPFWTCAVTAAASLYSLV